MWFGLKTLIAVDTRSAALAVYRNSLSGPRLERFGFERYPKDPRQESLFADVIVDSRSALSRLVRDLNAPLGDVTFALPVGAVFPVVLDASSLRRGGVADVGEDEMARFRLAPLLPFSVAQAEVQTERLDRSSDSVLAQAALKSQIQEARSMFEALGAPKVRITSVLSAALRGLSSAPSAVDLVYGDSACAIVVRGSRGFVEAVHLRLLLEGDDREQRALDETFRAAPNVAEIRVVGAPTEGLTRKAIAATVVPAFASSADGPAEAQSFPFLGVFREAAAR